MSSPSRSTIVLAALQKEIAERRSHLDTATDIAEVCVYQLTVRRICGIPSVGCHLA